MYTKESVKNAIKMNELEGLMMTEEEKQILYDVAAGKITVEECIKKNIEEFQKKD
ncbi:hypothetical protein [Fusobacterium sp. PH5-44]|uniref:hypothetical protein n=1 Tax=unclassified Fusobacterium TaxID=2648384 RepID=UPI003D20987A